MLHNLTTKQLRMVVDAIGDGTSWPKATNDPKVNYAVDCIVQDDGDVQPYIEELYVREIEAVRAAGLN